MTKLVRSGRQLLGSKHGIAFRIGQMHADDRILLTRFSICESYPAIIMADDKSQHQPQITTALDAEKIAEVPLNVFHV